jgi:hypothetical protein
MLKKYIKTGAMIIRKIVSLFGVFIARQGNSAMRVCQEQ